MTDETPHRPAGESPSQGRDGECGDAQSPLHTRAAFLANWDWQSIVLLNQRACQRGHAQHGLNSQAHTACRRRWEENFSQVLSLADAFRLLRQMHRAAPFLFFNGNTFAELGRELGTALFADLSPLLRRDVTSAIAHYIAGVLDADSLHRLILEAAQSYP